MSVHLRLIADSLPEDRQERLGARAEMISTALHHAAASPDYRLEMIIGEAYAEYIGVVVRLAAAIRKEAPETRRAFRRKAGPAPDFAAVQAFLISDAVAIIERTEPLLIIDAGDVACEAGPDKSC